jgi:hypothetical protein
MGNLMFGVGGAARGYPLGQTLAFAQGYNLTKDGVNLGAFNEDPRGSDAGWLISASTAYTNNETFCSVLSVSNSLFLGIMKMLKTRASVRLVRVRNWISLLDTTKT